MSARHARAGDVGPEPPSLHLVGPGLGDEVRAVVEAAAALHDAVLRWASAASTGAVPVTRRPTARHGTGHLDEHRPADDLDSGRHRRTDR